MKVIRALLEVGEEAGLADLQVGPCDNTEARGQTQHCKFSPLGIEKGGAVPYSD
jgi:hypothetical protein